MSGRASIRVIAPNYGDAIKQVGAQMDGLLDGSSFKGWSVESFHVSVLYTVAMQPLAFEWDFDCEFK